MKILTVKEQLADLKTRCKAIIETAKAETRDLSEEEEKEIEEMKREIEDKKEELAKLVRELDEKMPDDEEEKEEKASEEDPEDKKECKRNKNIKKNNKMKTYQKRFLDVVKNREYNREVNLTKRAIQVTGDDGTHDALIQEDFTDILEPLYANSILSDLGVRMRTGCVNDVHVPRMTKGTVGFLGEIEAANATTNEFDYVTLRPKRIGAYIDISEQQLIQDSLGVLSTVQTNLIETLNEYIEKELFSDHASSDLRPAGVFNGVTPTVVTDYADLCEFEADLEEADVYGDMKYAMSPKAKAAFRGMIKGTNATGMVYDRGEMDGVETKVSSAVPSKKFVYGNWKNLIFASWGDTILKISDSATGLITGEVRIYLGAYIDWAVLRPEAFAYGTTEE